MVRYFLPPRATQCKARTVGVHSSELLCAFITIVSCDPSSIFKYFLCLLVSALFTIIEDRTQWSKSVEAFVISKYKFAILKYSRKTSEC